LTTKFTRHILRDPQILRCIACSSPRSSPCGDAGPQQAALLVFLTRLACIFTQSIQLSNIVPVLDRRRAWRL